MNDYTNDLDETETPARLLLLAAVSLVRDGRVDSYTTARLFTMGYGQQQVHDLAGRLARGAMVLAGEKRGRVL